MYFLNNVMGWLCGLNGLVATYNSTVDINEVNDNAASASVFPNPAHNVIEVRLFDLTDKIIDIKVFNLQGKRIKYFPNLSEINSFKFYVSDLNKGTYIIHITSTNSKNLIKFIVQ